MRASSWLSVFCLCVLASFSEGFIFKKKILYHHYPVHIHKSVPVPVRVFVDRPYPVYIRRAHHFPVFKRVPVPVNVPVARPYPVERKVHVPYGVPVERPVPYHVVNRYPIYLEKKVAFPVEKTVHEPVEVVVDEPVPVHVPVEKPVPYKVPVDIRSHPTGGYNGENNQLQADYGQRAHYGGNSVDITGA